MAILGRLHPLLIHFPIALILGAAAAEAAVIVTGHDRWRTVARVNLAAAIALGIPAIAAGWKLAIDAHLQGSVLLEWHRWLGIAAMALAVVASLAAARTSVIAARQVYRVALFAAAALVASAGHLGALMVWGADFFAH